MAKPEHQERIKQGAPQWNHWRAEHPEVRPDLSGVRIPASIGGMDLRAAELRAADFSGLDLRNVVLIGADLYRATLRDADLRDHDLSRVNMSGADLCHVDGRGSDFRGALFTEAKLIGANLAETRFEGANLRGADLSGADLRAADFRGARLTQATLAGADLSDADLRGARFVETNLTGSKLEGARLGGTDLRTALIRRSDLVGAHLEDAKLPPSMLTETCIVILNRPDRATPPPVKGGVLPNSVPRFEIYGPTAVAPGGPALLDLWTYLPRDFDDVRATQREGSASPESTPLLAGDIPLTVDIHIPHFGQIVPANLLVWRGAPIRSTFGLIIPNDTQPGNYSGTAQIRAFGMRVCTVAFSLRVEDWLSSTTASLTAGCAVPRRAYACFAPEDRDEALERTRAIGHLVPDVELLTDLNTLPDWADWKQRLTLQLPRQDQFFLFWSERAARSRRVTVEWEHALATRGLGFIDPVPLVDPTQTRPPPELRSLRFEAAFHHAWAYATLLKFL